MTTENKKLLPWLPRYGENYKFPLTLASLFKCMLSAKPRRISLGSFRKNFSSQSEYTNLITSKNVSSSTILTPAILQKSSLKSCFMKTTTTTTKAEDDRGSPTAKQWPHGFILVVHCMHCLKRTIKL